MRARFSVLRLFYYGLKMVQRAMRGASASAAFAALLPPACESVQ